MVNLAKLRALMAYSALQEAIIEDVWRVNREKSAAEITTLANQELGNEAKVSRRSVASRIKRFGERFQEPVPDPILSVWQTAPETGYGSNRASWPTDPDQIKTLTVLYDEAQFIIPKYSPDEFVGLTDRMAKWASRISSFFDHEHRLDRLMHLYCAQGFSTEERFLLGMKRDVCRLGMNSQPARMLMSWHQRLTDPERHLIRTPEFQHPPWDAPVDVLEEIVGEYLVAHLGLRFSNPEPLLSRDVVFRRANQENLAPNKTRQEILAEYQAQGIEVDESHDGLEIVYTHPEENEIPEQFWPLLEAQGWQRPTEERPRVFETSEAQVMIAAMMESYSGRLSEDEINELVLELERKFAEIDARNSDGQIERT